MAPQGSDEANSTKMQSLKQAKVKVMKLPELKVNKGMIKLPWDSDTDQSWRQAQFNWETNQNEVIHANEVTKTKM